ncbi:hypothetical protein BJ912DRAFT_1056825 [Pholiota molesta]|nr:hypothetical protein BJ912DRAFT_1056825 [Pholiota molesta]
MAPAARQRQTSFALARTPVMYPASFLRPPRRWTSWELIRPYVGDDGHGYDNCDQSPHRPRLTSPPPSALSQRPSNSSLHGDYNTANAVKEYPQAVHLKGGEGIEVLLNFSDKPTKKIGESKRSAEELFYQLGLRQFGDFSRIKLYPPPSLREMVEIGVGAENTESSDLSKSMIVDRIMEILLDSDRREMLSDYFSLMITEDGLVESLPQLLRDYVPNLENLPIFLMRLGPQVDWTSEAECFDNFLRELARFYTPMPPTSDTDEYKAERWQIKNILFSAMRNNFFPPKSLLDRDVAPILDIPDLYKVFGHC